METLKDVLVELTKLIPDYQKREEAKQVIEKWFEVDVVFESDSEVKNES